MLKVVLVYKYENFMLVVFKIVFLSFESLNNSLQLSIMSFILYLNKNHLLREKDY